MGNRDDVDSTRLCLVNHAEWEPPKHDETVLLVILGKHPRIRRDQPQYVIGFGLESRRRSWAPGLIPGEGRLVLGLGLRVEPDFIHRPPPEPAA